MKRFLIGLLAALAVTTPAQGAEIASPAAWTWFPDPRAIEFNERTVFGWVDGEGDVMVGDTIGRRFRLHPRLERDDHDNPALYVRRDGRLMAFWTAHDGDALFYRTARNLKSWGPTRTGPQNPTERWGHYTYPNPRRYRGRLYLFWSGLANTATYASSRNDGATWTPSRNLFTLEGIVRYIKYDAGRDGVHMAYVLGHPRNNRSAVYHAVLRHGKLWKQNGELIGRPPVNPTAGDVVYSNPAGSWVHDIAVKNRRPYIAFASFSTLANHRYHYAYWKGGWRNRKITDAGPAFPESPKEPHYSGGLSFDQHDPHRVYLSRKMAGQYEIERWVRKGGKWARRAVTRNSATLNVRPFSVNGGVAWMRGPYPSPTEYRTALMWRAD